MVKPPPAHRPARPSLARRALTGLLLVASSCLLTLGALELALRAFGVGDFHAQSEIQCVEPRSMKDDGPAYLRRGVLRITYPNNPRGYFDAGNSVSAQMNPQGFRGAYANFEKSNGVLRIAVIGDSFTLGYGVKDEDTFPVVMTREMSKARPVEVLNFGVTAFDSQDELKYFRDYVLRFSPDVVLWTYFLNDAELVNPQRFIDREPAVLTGVRAHSHLANWTLGLYERWRLYRAFVRHYQQGYNENSEGWRRAQQAMLEAKALAGENNVRFLMAVYPILIWDGESYPFETAHMRLADFCKANGIPLFDLLSVFRTQDADTLWVHPRDQHPNEHAQAMAGKALAAFVLEHSGAERLP